MKTADRRVRHLLGVIDTATHEIRVRLRIRSWSRATGIPADVHTDWRKRPTGAVTVEMPDVDKALSETWQRGYRAGLYAQLLNTSPGPVKETRQTEHMEAS